MYIKICASCNNEVLCQSFSFCASIKTMIVEFIIKYLCQKTRDLSSIRLLSIEATRCFFRLMKKTMLFFQFYFFKFSQPKLNYKCNRSHLQYCFSFWIFDLKKKSGSAIFFLFSEYPLNLI